MRIFTSIHQWVIFGSAVAVVLAALGWPNAGGILHAQNAAEKALSPERDFTSSAGKQVKGRILKVVGDQVTLRRSADGQVFTLSLDQFSEEDQEFIRELKPAAEKAPAKKRPPRRKNSRQESEQTEPEPETAKKSEPRNAKRSARTAADAGGDWPQWRGPGRDGVCSEKGLLDRWPSEGPPLEWRVAGLGGGMSSVSIANDLHFTMGQVRGETHILCRSASDGAEVWSSPIGGGGAPNCTPTVDPQAGLVFALTFAGDLACVELESGQVRWRKNYSRDFGGQMMSGWGYSESPLVDGDRLICTPGASDAMIVALDKNTGKLIWKSQMPPGVGRQGNDGAGYSSIVVSNGAGVKQYVQLTGRGVISVAAEDGEPLWVYNRVANGTANIPTPIVKDDFIFCSSGYGTGSALLRLSKRGRAVRADEVYFLSGDTLQNHHGGMVLVGDHVYLGHGHNNGFPMCVELDSGKLRWDRTRGPGSGSAAVLYAEGHLYFRYENGIMALIEANPRKYTLKGTFRIASDNGKSWPHPVIYKGRLYLRDQDELLCYNLQR